MKKKLRKFLAAWPLLPAAFVLHPTPWQAFRTMIKRPRAFFSAALYADFSNSAPLLNQAQILGRRLLQWQPPEIFAFKAQAANIRPLPVPNLQNLHNSLENPGLKAVSFDLFDTVLVRAALAPENVFALAAARVNSQYNIDFEKMRVNAEKKLGKPNATFREIWNFIAREYNLGENLQNILMQAEQECEMQLLMPQPEIMDFYHKARSQGKKIIICSDMYLPGEFLKTILAAHGFEPDAVYVSCECEARKDNGKLFAHLLEREQLKPEELLHIGDNLKSDYEQPARQGITAIWYPAPLTRALGLSGGKDYLPKDLFRDIAGIYIGLGIVMAYAQKSCQPKNIFQPGSLYAYSLMILAPFITAFCAWLLSGKIQKHYDDICFASRDGWLHYRLYNILASATSLPGKYFQSGRRAMLPFLATDLRAYINQLNPEIGYNLENFFSSQFHGADFYRELLATLPKANLPLARYQSLALELLEPFKEIITAFQKDKAKKAVDYYKSIFQADKSLLVDTGYSGSVGLGYEKITGRPAQKAYIWQSKKNIELDRANNSHTYCFCKSNKYIHANNLMLEELCSPPQGGCIGFGENGEPILEDIEITAAHKAAHAQIMAACEEYARKALEIFGADLPVTEDGDFFLPLVESVNRLPDSGLLKLFADIKFPDPLCANFTKSLQIKLEENYFSAAPFAGTAFKIKPAPLELALPLPQRIGIHLHLYYPELLQTSLNALAQLPIEYDLFITSPKDSLKWQLEYLAKNYLPKLRQLFFISTPNRGRDVAPWLVELGEQQKGYDAFCHMHAKKSEEYIFGTGWREFLFHHLLGNAMPILQAFAATPDLGCVLPPFYPPLANLIAYAPSLNTRKEQDLINNLLINKFGYKDLQCRTETIYSAGTMLWYKPKALEKLFQAGFNYEDFEPEPLGYANSLAHAIERLPAIIAQREGWQCRLTSDLPGFQPNPW